MPDNTFRAIILASAAMLSSCGSNETPEEEINRVADEVLDPLTPQINLWARIGEFPQPARLGIVLKVALKCSERLREMEKESILEPQVRQAEVARRRNCEQQAGNLVFDKVNGAVYGAKGEPSEQSNSSAPKQSEPADAENAELAAIAGSPRINGPTAAIFGDGRPISGTCFARYGGTVLMDGPCSGLGHGNTLLVTADKDGCTLNITRSGHVAISAYRNQCSDSDLDSADVSIGNVETSGACLAGPNAKVCLRPS